MTFKYFYKLFVRHIHSHVHIRKLRIENPPSLSILNYTSLWRDIRTDAIIVSSFPISKLEPLIQIGAASYSNPVELDLKKGPISLATCRQHPVIQPVRVSGLVRLRRPVACEHLEWIMCCHLWSQIKRVCSTSINWHIAKQPSRFVAS